MRKQIIVILSLIAFLSNTLIVEGASNEIPDYITTVAKSFNLDKTLLYAICTIESKCNPRAINRNDGTPSQKALGLKIKSYGLFQLQVDTAKVVGFVDKETVEVITKKHYVIKRHGKLIDKEKIITKIKVIDHTLDLLDPHQNTWLAASYIAHLYERYHNTNKVISAYNAGHFTHANNDYVLKVLKQYAIYKIDKKLK